MKQKSIGELPYGFKFCMAGNTSTFVKADVAGIDLNLRSDLLDMEMCLGTDIDNGLLRSFPYDALVSSFYRDYVK